MNNVIRILRKRKEDGKLLDLDDIKNIVKLLSIYFDIKITRVTNKNNKYIMSLNLNNLELIVDYKKIPNKKGVTYTNYMIVFLLIHELRHYAQLTNNSDSSIMLYQECMNYISSSSLLKNAFYSRFHDYFPTEINANIVGLLYIMYIQKELNDYEYYNLSKAFLIDLFNNLKTETFQDVLSSIFDSDYKIVLDTLDEYTLFINGLLENKDEEMKVLENILL